LTKAILLLWWFVATAAAANIDNNQRTKNQRTKKRTQERGLYWEFEPFDATVDPNDVQEIHVVFSNHMDVGFNSRAWCDGGSLQGCIGPQISIDGQKCRPWSYYVINANMNTFIPRAANLANELRNTKYGFSYMTHPYAVAFLLDCEESGLTDWRPGPTYGKNLLECPNRTTIQQFKEAVKSGDVWWHAFPHNPMPGLYDASLFNASLAIGRSIAQELGVREPTTYSQRDETGMTRSIVPLLAANNVGMISLGAGGGSGGHPVIPDLFVWKDNATNTSVIFVFDHGYGGGLHVLPSNGVGIYCAWNTDNGGPLSKPSIENIYNGLRKKYPNANVHESTFDDFYDVASQHKQGLPIITKEIGDTWLYGVPADPFKNVMFRELSRHRRDCIERNLCQVSDVTMKRFDRLLTKIPEHTWGEDTTWYLSSYLGNRAYPLGDYMNWTNVQFDQALKSPEYHMAIESWLDQRNYLSSAIDVLEKDNKYTALASQMKDAMANILPSIPDTTEYEKIPGTPAEQSANWFTCNGRSYRINMDMSMILGAAKGEEKTRRGGGASTSAAEHVLGLYTYQTIDASDYTKFDQDYGMSYCTPTTEDAGCHNFNKPNMTSAHPVHSETNPSLVQIYVKKNNSIEHDGDVCAFHVSGSLPIKLHEMYGAPSTIWTSVKISVPAAAHSDDERISLIFNVQWFNKTKTRLAEAQWVTFNPYVMSPNGGGWAMRGFRKTGLSNDAANNGIDPMKVVTHGAVHLHSLGPFSTIEYRQNSTKTTEAITLTSLDVPIVSAGLLSPFPTPGNWTIDLSEGMHYNLQNNIWNVNFPQWYPFIDGDKDARFRFEVEL
jgi:hypothetical protein